MFKPDIKLNKITDIAPSLLREKNIDTLILDVDNTLSTHHGTVLVEGLETWLDTIKKEDIKLIILSNSKEKRVKPFAENLGLDYVSLGLKPLPFKYFTAIEKIGGKRKNTAIVGDQLFTDCFGAKLTGITSIILNPILPEPMLSFKIRRNLEKKLYKKYKME